MKKSLIITTAILTVFLFGCGGNPELKNADEIKDRSEQQITSGGKPIEDLKANAIEEGDTEGLVKWSLGRVQEELRKSVGIVGDLGEVTILLDENMQMVIRNEKDGIVYEKRVKLASLNTDVKSIQIVVDNVSNPHPGFKLAVLDGEPGVDYYKNGTKLETKQELEILLGERRQVQLVVSAMVQAIKTAKESM